MPYITTHWRLELDEPPKGTKLDAGSAEPAWGYCGHCGAEQAPPTVDVPTCCRCSGWLLREVYV